MAAVVGEDRRGVARAIDDREALRIERPPGDSVVQAAVVVVDAMGSEVRPPGLLVHSVAELARRASFNVSIVSGADVEVTQKECERMAASVVLLPLYLPPTDGRSLLDAVALWEAPAVLSGELTKQGFLVIAVTVGGPAALLAACVADGAIGVISSADLNLSLHGLRHTLVASPAIGSLSHLSIRSHIDQPPLPNRYNALLTLTSAERRVLNAMMQGWSASDMATSLVVSVSTVRTHIRSILAKLDVSSQISAVAIGYGVDPGEVAIEPRTS